VSKNILSATPSSLHRFPLGMIAMVAFFGFGTVMSGLTCFLLIFPGGPADMVWRLNPEAHRSFLQMGGWAALLMAVVCLCCAISTFGMLARTLWGYRCAIAVLAVNLLGDLLNAAMRHDLRTLIGLPIGGAMIAYLLSDSGF
jgi:hypothetical protein